MFRGRGRRNYNNFDEYRRRGVARRNKNLDNFYSNNFGYGVRRRYERFDNFPPSRPRNNFKRRDNNRRDAPFRDDRPRRRPRIGRRGERRGPQQGSPTRRRLRRKERKNRAPIEKNGNKRTGRRLGRRMQFPVGKLNVSNLSVDTINEDLITIFGAYGTLKRCAVIFANGESTRTGVVQFFSRACADRAFQDLNGTFLKGNYISLEIEKPQKKDKPAQKEENKDVEMQ